MEGEKTRIVTQRDKSRGVAYKGSVNSLRNKGNKGNGGRAKPNPNLSLLEKCWYVPSLLNLRS